MLRRANPSRSVGPIANVSILCFLLDLTKNEYFLIDNIPSLSVNLGVEGSVGSIEVKRAGWGRPLAAIL